MNIELSEDDRKKLISLLDLCAEADSFGTAFYLDEESIEQVEQLRELFAESEVAA